MNGDPRFPAIVIYFLHAFQRHARHVTPLVR
jgi:hypothetical protein